MADSFVTKKAEEERLSGAPRTDVVVVNPGGRIEEITAELWDSIQEQPNHGFRLANDDEVKAYRDWIKSLPRGEGAGGVETTPQAAAPKSTPNTQTSQEPTAATGAPAPDAETPKAVDPEPAPSDAPPVDPTQPGVAPAPKAKPAKKNYR